MMTKDRREWLHKIQQRDRILAAADQILYDAGIQGNDPRFGNLKQRILQLVDNSPMAPQRTVWTLDWVIPADSTLRGVGIYGDTRVLATDLLDARNTFDSLMDVDFFFPGAGSSASDPDVVSGSYRWYDEGGPVEDFDADAMLKEDWHVELMGISEVEA